MRVPYVGHVLDIAVPHMHRVISSYDRTYGPIHRWLFAGRDVVSVSDPQVRRLAASARWC